MADDKPDAGKPSKSNDDEKDDKKPDDDSEGGDKEKKGGDDKTKKKTPVWPFFAAAGVVVVFSLIVLWIIFAPHAEVRTTDAYVTAHYATIAPRVSGQVTAVAVTDNQRVHTGDLLVALDDRDYVAALQQAEAAVASDRAQAAEATAQVARQPALIRQAQAQVASAEAHRNLSASDAGRYANLARTGAGTVQQSQQSATALRQDEAAVAQARAELTAQVKQLDALRATAAAADARIAEDAARVAQARLNLSYTHVIAPIDGVVDQRQVQVGDFLAPGMPVMTVTPLNGVYVMANYREVSLRHMRPGQPARIHVDAYDIDLDGVVDSIPPATGAAYSPIPPNNATGNFTKIVQRLPVKVVFVTPQPLLPLVRVGMSTEVVIDTGLEDVVAEQRGPGARSGRPAGP